MSSNPLSITTKQLVTLFGTEQQKSTYEKTRKLPPTTKASILRTASLYCMVSQSDRSTYTIHKRYSSPLPDFVLSTSYKKASQIYTYILTTIQQQSIGTSYVFSQQELYNAILPMHIINRIRNNIQEASYILHVQQRIINNIIQSTFQALTHLTNIAISDLESIDAIHAKHTYLIRHIKPLTPQEDESKQLTSSYILATDDEYAIIEQALSSVREKLQLSPKEAYFSSHTKQYHAEVATLLAKANIYSYQKVTIIEKGTHYASTLTSLTEYNEFNLTDILLDSILHSQYNAIQQKYATDEERTNAEKVLKLILQRFTIGKVTKPYKKETIEKILLLPSNKAKVYTSANGALFIHS